MKFIHSADIHLDSPLVGLELYDGAPVDQIEGQRGRHLRILLAWLLTNECLLS